ncbi:other/PEK/GCN2 protein kinase [Crepidotus variabilis]|uniref:non-specific serine/threonine protein kinase n=1 Tax=Crepidotus variabilis TaxID=179855 RepID=A0A9P6EE81_9AGAR|nr:other/PEK/GCN2 protein kinase [Crepidotus variabilis]
MDSTDDPQTLEITALQSIYAEDFIPCPPPKAWKGAATLHEFIINVAHPDPDYATKICLRLHVKFPKTYPRLACATFAIERPISGINDNQVSRLSHEINAEAQKLRGSEMVFTIVTFAQDWISANVTPPVEVVGSLAVQMNQRAIDEERARQQREQEEAERAEEIANRAAQELDEQIQADAMRQLMAKEQQFKARRRANSESTEVPPTFNAESITESFQDMDMNGVKFNTVKLFHPRPVSLGLVYMAEPVVDDITTVTPLELFVVTFESAYYESGQGKKKISQVEQEVKSLINIRHPKLLSVYAVKLVSPPHSPPVLMVLTEQTPALTLHDVLEDCEYLREDRASDYAGQILAALNAVHLSGLVHRGITTRCVGLTSKDNPSQPKMIKLCKAAFHTRLLDLHRSNSFGAHTPMPPEYQLESSNPEGWLSKDVQHESSLIYTRQRDIHDVGIILLKMLLGLDIVDRYPDPITAIHSSPISPLLARQALSMIQASKKSTVMNLLSEMNEGVSYTPILSSKIPAALLDPRTPTPFQYGSPEGPDYFRMHNPPKAKQASRWKEDWEELEMLGRGAFGSVVKAKNKIDARIYAVKKVRLKSIQSDKIFREVNALSRLSHRNIVRYYTTWVETAEPDASIQSSDDSSAESGTEDADFMTSVPPPNTPSKGLDRHRQPINGGFQINFEDFDDLSVSRSSFPSIHFGRSGSTGSGGTSGEDSTSSDEQDQFAGLFKRGKSTSGSKKSSTASPTPSAPILNRTLYIQMEFVERQTLRELVDEGISEDEAWRLFQQIVDALAHMSTLGILHRDIKLANIFIDAKGDCKVGDFGLATSSLAAVEPTNLAPLHRPADQDMTLEVGTRLYIAPEVQSRKRRGPRDHSKADMYSLGIVFFEMNFKFNTGAERIAVLEDIRKPAILFPLGWDQTRIRQREIIIWLLQHDPVKRPNALELSQSQLLPARLEDEYFKGALRLMAKPESQHHQTVLATLFKQPPRPSRAFIYDVDAEQPDYAVLNDIVKDRLSKIFHLHGAVDSEPPLLTPIMDVEEEKSQATFIDPHGDIVALPNNILVPFARLAARGETKRIKRYHITNVFRPNSVAGHPKFWKAAVFDIISPDLTMGPVAAAAELISVANDCLDSFPNLSQHYDIHISHSKIVEIMMNRIPGDARSGVIDTIQLPKSTPAQKRALLSKRNLSRITIDEIELLAEVAKDADEIMIRLERTSPALATLLAPLIKDISSTIQFAQSAGVSRTIFFHPLMLGNHHTHFKDGVLVEVVRRSKNSDVLAAGGRYDNLINRFHPAKQKPEPVCALAIQIAVEKITSALASYQASSLKTLVKEDRSFGFWSPRRCDVYIVSYHPGYLQERLEVAAYLWQHNISADLMYESGLPDAEHENHLDICAREGILFTVYPRPRSGRNLPAFKVKSTLKGTEVDLSRQELVGWLHSQIAEQKRIDATTTGVANALSEVSVDTGALAKEPSGMTDVQLVLPDTKKRGKQVKQIFTEKAYEKASAIKGALQANMPVLAVDVTQAHFEAMLRTPAWISDEESWKAMAASYPNPPGYSGYHQSIREAVQKRKSEGNVYVLLFAVREDKGQLLALV